MKKNGPIDIPGIGYGHKYNWPFLRFLSELPDRSKICTRFFPQMLKTLARLPSHIDENIACSLWMVDSNMNMKSSQKRVVFMASHNFDDRDNSAEFLPSEKRKQSLNFGEGLVGWVANTKESYFCESLCKDQHFLSKMWAQRLGLCSSISLPLLKSTELVGVYNIYFRRKITEKAARDFLSELGDLTFHMPILIDHVWRNIELNILDDIRQFLTINYSNNFDNLCRTVIGRIKTYFTADGATILLWDSRHRVLWPVASANLDIVHNLEQFLNSVSENIPADRVYSLGEGLTGYAARAFLLSGMESLRISNIRDSDNLANVVGEPRLKSKLCDISFPKNVNAISYLASSISQFDVHTRRTDFVGLVRMTRISFPHEFTAFEEQLLLKICKEIGPHLREAFLSMEQSLDGMFLNRIRAQVACTKEPDIAPILQEVLRRCCFVTGASSSLLWIEDAKARRFLMTTGDIFRSHEDIIKLGVDWKLLQNEILSSPTNLNMSSEVYQPISMLCRTEKSKNVRLISVPLSELRDAFGSVLLAVDQHDVLQTKDLNALHDLIGDIALYFNLISTAISKTERLDLVMDIAAATAADFNIDDILQQMSDSIKQIFNPTSVVITLSDGNSLAIRCSNISNMGGDYSLGNHLRFLPNCLRNDQNCIKCKSCDGLNGRCATLKIPQLISNINNIVPEISYLVFDSDARSELVVPMVFRGNVIGTIDIYHIQDNAFSKEDATYLEMYGNYVAVALNATKYFSEHESLMKRINRELSVYQLSAMAIAMIHDINSHIKALSLNLNLLKVGIDTHDEKAVQCSIEQLSGITDNAANLLKIVNTFSTHRGKSAHFQINECLATLKHMGDAYSGDRRHSIQLHIDGVIPPVFTNQKDLNIILYNILCNAIDFSKARSRIDIRAKYISGYNETEIVIQDYGVGMDRQGLEELFVPWKTSKGELGIGLGMFVARELCNFRKLRIECDSAPNKGTTFTIKIPGKLGNGGLDESAA